MAEEVSGVDCVEWSPYGFRCVRLFGWNQEQKRYELLREVCYPEVMDLKTRSGTFSFGASDKHLIRLFPEKRVTCVIDKEKAELRCPVLGKWMIAPYFGPVKEEWK